jgi:hypothetical protein
MLIREPDMVRFSSEAMRANLLRLQNEWEKIQASRERGAIYGYPSLPAPLQPVIIESQLKMCASGAVWITAAGSKHHGIVGT